MRSPWDRCTLVVHAPTLRRPAEQQINRASKVFVTNRFGDVFHRGNVFGEAAAAVTATGFEERRSNSAVSADAFADVFHICAVGFAQNGHFVHERDTRGEHAVGGVFGQLS